MSLSLPLNPRSVNGGRISPLIIQIYRRKRGVAIMEERDHLIQEIMPEYDFQPESPTPEKWLLPNLVVRVGEEGFGAFLGIIREIVDEGTCLVAVYDSDDGEHVVASPSDLKMVVPEIMDDVKVVSCEYRHKKGQLLDITSNGQHGLVLFDDEDQMRRVEMGLIGKLAYIREAVSNDESKSRSHSRQ